MVATKILLAALATYITATPIDLAPNPAHTDVSNLALPKNVLQGIDREALKSTAPASYNDKAVRQSLDTSLKVSDRDINTIASGSCEQGKCPDYGADFDLAYELTEIPVSSKPGEPPVNNYFSSSHLRIDACGECYRFELGSSPDNDVTGGCHQFNACGLEQAICVDPGKHRAHRTWEGKEPQDGQTKKCYRLQTHVLGDCSVTKARIVLEPTEVVCDW